MKEEGKRQGCRREGGRYRFDLEKVPERMRKNEIDPQVPQANAMEDLGTTTSRPCGE